MNIRIRLFRRWALKRRANLSPTQIIAITFAVIILIGTVLLGNHTPAHTDNHWHCLLPPVTEAPADF